MNSNIWLSPSTARDLDSAKRVSIVTAIKTACHVAHHHYV
jgi:hypothetical protein